MEKLVAFCAFDGLPVLAGRDSCTIDAWSGTTSSSEEGQSAADGFFFAFLPALPGLVVAGGVLDSAEGPVVCSGSAKSSSKPGSPFLPFLAFPIRPRRQSHSCARQLGWMPKA